MPSALPTNGQRHVHLAVVVRERRSRVREDLEHQVVGGQDDVKQGAQATTSRIFLSGLQQLGANPVLVQARCDHE